MASAATNEPATMTLRAPRRSTSLPKRGASGAETSSITVMPPKTTSRDRPRSPDRRSKNGQRRERAAPADDLRRAEPDHRPQGIPSGHRGAQCRFSVQGYPRMLEWRLIRVPLYATGGLAIGTLEHYLIACGRQRRPSNRLKTLNTSSARATLSDLGGGGDSVQIVLFENTIARIWSLRIAHPTL